MAQYHYQRVLVKFRTSTPGQWSELHWCDIEQDSEHQQILIKVAPTNLLSMPMDHEFVPLSAEQTKKLLVVDVSSENVSMYCLVCTNTTLCRFDFNRLSQNYMKLGRYWSLLDNYYAKQPDLALQAVFSADEIVADPRLQMRAQPLADYQVLNDISPSIIQHLKQQYQNRGQQSLESQSVATNFPRSAVEAEQPIDSAETQEILSEWLNDRYVPVVVNIHDIASRLDEVNRILLIYPVCEALAALKANTQSTYEYERALLNILQRSEQTSDLSDSLKFAVQSFRDRFLVNSIDLNRLFSENNNAPLMNEVYHFVLDVVFEELKTHRPVYQDTISSNYKKACPDSYATQRLGRASTSAVGGERLIDPIIAYVDAAVPPGQQNRLAAPIIEYVGGAVPPRQRNHGFSLLDDPIIEYVDGAVPPRQRNHGFSLFADPIIEYVGGAVPRRGSSSRLNIIGCLCAVSGSIFSAVALTLFLTGGSMWLAAAALVCAYSLYKVSYNILSLLKENQQAAHAPIAIDQVPLDRILDLRPSW